MKIDKNINMAIITDNNLSVLKQFANETIISDINDIKANESKYVVFNDSIRYLKKKDQLKLFERLNKSGVHFAIITSNIEEVIYVPYLVVYTDDKVQIEGPLISVLKEEKILKRLGFGLPFVFDVSLQLNYYGLLDTTYLDAKGLVDKLW